MKMNVLYLSESAKIVADAFFGKIWIKTTYKYLAADFDGTARLRTFRINHLVL